MLSKLLRHLRPDIDIQTSVELREGSASVFGVAHSESPELSPFRGRRCVAYVYRVLRMVQTRGGSAPSVVRERTFHSSFELKLSDGTVLTAHPKKSSNPITKEEHTAMISSGEEGIFFDESVVPVGNRVRLSGMVLKREGGWSIRYGALEDLGEAPLERAAPSGRRKGKKRRT